jgi:methylmalonyl-CoA/ethylmalonyl-CoA epimerase
MYAVNKDGTATVKYVEVAGDNLVLRPHNQAYPVEIMPIETDKNASSYLVGRVCHVGIETWTATMNIGISRVGQIAINARDIDRATAFYRDKLGLPLLFTAGKLAFFDCGGVRLMLDVAEKPEFDHPSSILYFSVPDIAAAHSQMLASGVRFEDEPHVIAKMPDHDLWMTFFRDSEQNLLALMSEVPAQHSSRWILKAWPQRARGPQKVWRGLHRVLRGSWLASGSAIIFLTHLFSRSMDDEIPSIRVPTEEFMDEVSASTASSRRNEDIALDLMKFVAMTTGYGRTSSSGVGFQGSGAASKPEDYANHLLELYGRCLEAVQRKK